MATKAQQVPDELQQDWVEEDLIVSEYGQRPDQTFGPELDRYVDRMIEDYARLEAEIEGDEAAFKAAVERLKARRDDVVGVKLLRMERLKREIGRIAQIYDFGSKRSRDLFSGSFGFRKKPARLEIEDPKAVLQWCEEHGVALRVKVEPDLSELQKIFRNGKVDTGSGEVLAEKGVVPPGAKVVPESDEVFIKGAK